MSPRIRLTITLLFVVTWTILNSVFFKSTILPGSGWRYLLLPPIVAIFVIWIGARYICTAYQLRHMSQALQYLLASLFEVGLPFLMIGDGKPLAVDGEENLVLKIGGPGRIKILPGSAVLIENYLGSVRVLGPGEYRLFQCETVKEIISLDERHRSIERLSARSKDGIEVTAQDIGYRFRIAGNDVAEGDSAVARLFEFSEEAVIRMVYNRVQGSHGLISWEDGVNSIVETIITAYINRHLVDYLTAPRDQGIDPRAEIYSEFYNPEGRRKFLEWGAELIWIDIGHFETTEKSVAMQRVSTWMARRQGDLNPYRVNVEAQEAGKLEAQRDLLISMEKVFKQAASTEEPREKIRSQILERISQILDG